MALYSPQLERHVIGGLIQNPQVFPDIEAFLNEKDFYIEPHNVIFACLKNLILNQEKPDKVILAQKIKNLGISFKEGINIYDYIEALSLAPITPEATIKACQEIVKFRALRDIEKTSVDIKDHVNKSANEPLDKTIGEVDSIYGKVMNSFSFEDEPQPLYLDVYEKIEELGNNPLDEIGLATPYSKFNEYYGGLRGGNLYCFCARKGEGKSTLLADLSERTAERYDIPVLYLDTEMSRSEVAFRRAAAISGVQEWLLESGNWRKNTVAFDKVRKGPLPNLKNTKSKVYHLHVGNKSIDEICSIIRRWYLKVVGRGKKGIVVYDYIKLVEKTHNNWSETQALGQIVDKLKKISEEFDFPLLTAIQLNRSGENAGRDSSDVIDDASAIAQTDRLVWYATYVGIFRRRTVNELTLDTEASGSHKLIQIKARWQGRNSRGHNDYVQRTFPDGSVKYVRNFISFNVDNFAVEERGDIQDCINRQNAILKIQDPHHADNNTL